MQTIEYKAFDERITKFRLHDRLDVVVIHKPRFSKTYVTLTTPLGSIHRHYRDEAGTHETPAGIAHFLEHKVFEKNGVDVSSEFARDEAQVNAYTEHTKTTYLFHATANVFEHVKRLLTMFFQPDFTDAGVAKEKNIIAEELNMHLDDPYYQQYHAVLNQLFHKHPVREDILGTNTSIQAITTDALRTMHQAYYRPDVCTLTVVGDIDITAFHDALSTQVTLPNTTTRRPYHPLIDEPHHVRTRHQTLALDVLVPNVLLGIKTLPEGPMNPRRRIKRHLAMTMLYDLVFGKSTDLYETLLDDGLINDSYGLDIQLEASYGYVLIGSESHQPDALIQRLHDVLMTLSTHPTSHDDFARYKKQTLGGFVMSLDSLEYIAHETARHIKDGLLFHDVLDIARSVTFDDVLALKQDVAEERIAVTLAVPNAKQKKNTL